MPEVPYCPGRIDQKAERSEVAARQPPRPHKARCKPSIEGRRATIAHSDGQRTGADTVKPKPRSCPAPQGRRKALHPFQNQQKEGRTGPLRSLSVTFRLLITRV